jgi:cysteine desulfurase
MFYFDYNATTPVLPSVFEEMKPYFCEKWGNPSASYSFGSLASNAVEEAREKVARLIGAQPSEIFFTGSATESNQTVLHGVSGSIISSTVEHSSINDYIKSRGNVRFAPVNSLGEVDLEQLDSLLCQEKAELVSVILANNETGVISPVKEISDLCQKYEVLFHSDAVQAVGKTAIDVTKIDVDYLSLSAHKIYGPKGVGALYVREGAPYKPFLVGSQEKTRRGGTEAVPLVVGFGVAAELAAKELAIRTKLTKQMRDMLENGILQSIPDAYLNGLSRNRLPNTSNIGFRGMDSEVVIQLLGNLEIMVSNGSACKSSAITPSHVLTAMGKSHDEANEAIRFSVSHLTTKTEVEHVVSSLARIVKSV